jgi:hypothetical protein
VNNNATAQQGCREPTTTQREQQTRRRDLRYHCNNWQNEGESIAELGHRERTLASVGGLDATNDLWRTSMRGAPDR